MSTNDTRVTSEIDGYDRCWQQKLPSMSSHERNLYHPDKFDNGLHRGTSDGNDGRWLAHAFGSGDMETGSLLDVSFFLSSLLLFWRSRPGINGVGTGFTTSGSQSMGGGVSPCARSAERSSFSWTDRLWDLWVHTVAYVG